ncbi:MAG TPA: triose-phosphate isomerase [Melioribacteraceae bacterium]|nr:triose-phosphate isomerase [Melioribacteraceae bacterium]
MRKKIVAGNWKMFNNLNQSITLISEIKQELANIDTNCEVVICPPFTSLETASTLTKDSPIAIGSQNMYFEESGAYTGEISADMLLSVGCEYVILGHSERRTIFKETDELINKKVKKAIAKGLKPIFCIGETLQEREENRTEKVIEVQVKAGLNSVTAEEFKNVVIAYEPVWAIGTGKTATPDQAQEVHKFIRNLLVELYGNDIANNTVIQYGGSVKPENAKELLAQADIDGALVGGACLKAVSFIDIIKAA